MKRVAIVGAVIALAVPATGAAENRPHPTLDAVATAVAGKPLTVHCETDWLVWIKAFESVGENGTFVNGFTNLEAAVVYVNPRQCETLHAMLNGWSVGTYYAASALLTLVHESVHQRGITDEGVTDCTALPLVPGIATSSFQIPATVSEQYLAPVKRQLVFRVNGKRIVRTVTTQGSRFRVVPNPWLSSLVADALAWHRAKPPEYQGGC
jgi:hypothetical protein